MTSSKSYPVQNAKSIFNTPIGRLVAEVSNRGIVSLSLASDRLVRARQQAPVSATAKQKKFEKQLSEELDKYFRGQLKRFRTPIDFCAGTNFQRSVWAALRAIPAGQTRSYGEVAKQVGHGGAARAVGSACNKNPVILLVPCHRVTSAHSLGGFAVGLKIKQTLLQLESDKNNT